VIAPGHASRLLILVSADSVPSGGTDVITPPRVTWPPAGDRRTGGGQLGVTS